MKTGTELCKNLLFDRTKNLNGYTINTIKHLNSDYTKFVVSNTLITKDSLYRDLNNSMCEDEWFIASMLAKYLNISVKIAYGFPELNHEDAILVGKMLNNHFIDLFLRPTELMLDKDDLVLANVNYISHTMYFYYDFIFTHNRGFFTPLEKIFNFYGWLTIIATLIILLMTSVVIYISNSKKNFRLSFTVFECLKLITNNSICTPMETFKMRAFFFGIFWYFLVIQATFSGHLAAFLTKPEYRKSPQTLEDLRDPSYITIHAHEAVRNYMKDPLLLKKTKFGGQIVLTNKEQMDSIAVIFDKPYVSELMVKYDFQCSKNVLNFGYGSMIMRHNWALRERVNNIIMWAVQSGIMEQWFNLVTTETKKTSGILQERTIHRYRPVQFTDVNFAFILLALGLFCAFACFVIELCIKICRINNKKVRAPIKVLKQSIVLIIRIYFIEFSRLAYNMYERLTYERRN